MRRRAIGQILLLAAGLVVLTVISAGSVYLVNKAREDARSLSTPWKSKTRYRSPNCSCAAPKAPARLSLDAAAGFSDRLRGAASCSRRHWCG